MHKFEPLSMISNQEIQATYPQDIKAIDQSNAVDQAKRLLQKAGMKHENGGNHQKQHAGTIAPPDNFQVGM